MHLRWLGHASVLIEDGATRILTDPVLGSRLGHLTRRSPAIGMAGLGQIDAVLISHVHRDHLDVRTLKRLSGGPRFLLPVGAAEILRSRGFTSVGELAAGDSARVGPVDVTAVPAHHPARRSLFVPWVMSLGFLIQGEARVYFAGDTDVFDEMTALAPLDVALLPVWGWGPSLGSGHLDPRTAAEALQLLRPRIAVPIHWGTFFPVGLRGRRLVDPPHEFARHAAELAPAVDVRILAPGDALQV